MKRFYFVFSAQKDGKNYAGTMVKTDHDNLAFLNEQIPNLTAVQICGTKKRADEIANFWNESFKINGTSLFA